MSQFFASGGQIDEYNSYQNLTKILLKIPDTVMNTYAKIVKK